MTNRITCDQFMRQLSALLEGDIDDASRATLEAHALGCPDCGSLLADVRRMRIDAANLPALEPARDLWAGIAERIETPVYALPATGEHRATTPRRRGERAWLGAAAAALVLGTALITRAIVARPSGARAVQTVAAAPDTPALHDSAVGTSSPTASVAAVPTPESSATGPTGPAGRATAPGAAAHLTLAASHAARPSAEQTYSQEIDRLRAVVAVRRPYLDSTTVAVVEHNLAVIDTAIAQCRAALRKDPASRFLLESLDDALDTKVQLLRTAALLPNRAS